MDKSGRILYAEDSLMDAELTMIVLNEIQLPHVIDHVTDGEEALDYLFYRGKYAKRQKESPAFVVLDLKMPKIDGIDVLKAIRQSESYAFIPVIIFSSSQIESDINKCFENGANSYVPKPIDFKLLTNVLQSMFLYWSNINSKSS